MFTEQRAIPFSRPDRRASGVALIITLSLLLLVTVVIVAFFGRTTTNQQITSSSANGVTAEVYGAGATDAIIASLQQEMLAGSFAAPGPTPAPPATGAPYIMPPSNSYAVSPSRSLRSDSTISTATPGTDPNAAYFQFANLVKQSANNVYTYNVPAAPGTSGTAVHGAYIASDVKTTTRNPNGRSYDGTFWNQPKLVSVPSTGTNGTTDLDPLIPHWVYTDRTGAPVLPGSLTDRVAQGATLNSKNVVGRYAYNIYNTGGILDANMVASGLAQNTAPSYNGVGRDPVATEIVPGYKGSVLTADLSGLTLNNALKFGGSNLASPADWQQLPKWRAAGNWNTNSTNYNGFAYVLSGGQFNGWLNDFFQPFDPTMGKLNKSASFLTNNRFTSRQDLINWVNTYWNPNHDTTGAATWMLPYLTHFSYDTDAPTFAPDPNRPKVIANTQINGDRSGVLSGENDAYNVDYNLINSPFVGPFPTGGVSGLVDANGNPLVKRRFPLSALSLIANYGPGNPFPPATMAPTDAANLVAQVQYDFGLVWSNNLADPQTGEKSPGWVYQDVDSTAPSLSIMRLSQIKNDRSPNFFELLKAAINVGSLGKQFGCSNYDRYDTANNVYDPSSPKDGGRFGVTANQIMQIGANIISQTSTNYTPTHIRFVGTNIDYYGVQDLPYLYRSRHIAYLTDKFTGNIMKLKTPLTSPPTDGRPTTNSALAVRVVQPELWNPHAPNQVGNPSTNPPTGYPIAFRVVPTQFVASYTQASNGVTDWINPYGPTPPTVKLQPNNSTYTVAGGPDCRAGITYPPLTLTDAAHPPTYLRLSTVVSPGTSVMGPGSSLAAFREPCVLLAANVPPGLSAVGQTTTNIANFNASMPTSKVDLSNYPIAPGGSPNTGVIPTYFDASANGNNIREVFGFNLGYFCAGPVGTTPGSGEWLSIDYQSGGQLPTATTPYIGMFLTMQYSLDGTNFYTYDVADSAGPYQQHLNVVNNRPEIELGTRTDPRTHRWGFMWARPHGFAVFDYTKGQFQAETAAWNDVSLRLYTISPSKARAVFAAPSWNGTYSDANANPSLGYSQTNQPPASLTSVPTQQRGSNKLPSTTYYQDPDGVVRLADGAYVDKGATDPANLGLPMFMPNVAVTGASDTVVVTAPPTPPNTVGPVTDLDSRPVMLNRPFQSVADLGYVFRDMPWRSLDFFTPQSGDTALLDVFTAYGPDPWSYASSNAASSAARNSANTATSFVNEAGLVTGRIDLNTAQAPVLAALIQGTLVNTPSNTATIYTTSTVAANIAQALVTWTHKQNSTQQGPLRNRAELVGKFVPADSTSSSFVYSGFSYGDPSTTSAQLTSMLSPLGSKATVIKQQRECMVRALADVGTTRTWNVLIDVVAQTGRLTPNAGGLKDFIITGEKHQWVSVAIDRITGKVIKMQAEPVRS